MATTCASQITGTQTSIVCQSTATWPPTGDYEVRIDGFAPGTSQAIFEDVIATANVQGTGTITVTRGQDSTGAQAFAAGATLTPIIGAKQLTDAFARIDTTVAQAFSGPITVPSSGGVALPTTSYGSMPVKIDDILVGTDTRYPSATPQITFLNTSNSGTNLLPTGFRHLQVIFYCREDGAASSDNMIIRFNADGATHYVDERVLAAAASAVASETNTGTASPRIAIITGATGTANFFSGGTIDIPMYGSTVGNKVAIGRSGAAGAVTTGLIFNSQNTVVWTTTATPITRVDLLPGTGNFVNGSQFSLWGLP